MPSQSALAFACSSVGPLPPATNRSATSSCAIDARQAGHAAGAVEVERGRDVESLQRADHAGDRTHEGGEAPHRLRGLDDALALGADRGTQRPKGDACPSVQDRRVTAGRALWRWGGRSVRASAARSSVLRRPRRAEPPPPFPSRPRPRPGRRPRAASRRSSPARGRQHCTDLCRCEPLDEAMPAQAVREAVPAARLTRDEERPEPEGGAHRLREEPWAARRKAARFSSRRPSRR